MKYLCLAYYDVKAFEALSPAAREAIESRCGPHDEALRASGHLVAQASLGEQRSVRAVRPRKGRVTVTDGPFAEAKEMVGGFFIVEARDMEEAVRIASLHPAAHLGEEVGWGIEVWPTEGLDDLEAPGRDR